MKTKTMYMGILASAEVTQKKIREILRDVPRSEWEHTLSLYALEHDQSPMLYEPSEDMSEADARFNSYFNIDDPGSDIVTISCTALEKYTSDEDGGYIEGGDFDFSDMITEEQIQQLTAILDR